MQTDRQVEELKSQVEELTKKVEALSARLENQNEDNNPNYFSPLKEDSQGIRLNESSLISIGGHGITAGTTYDATNGKINRIIGANIVGPDMLGSTGESTPNSQFIVEHLPLVNETFYYANRPPTYLKTTGISFTSGTSSMSDGTKLWATDELVGCWVQAFDSTNALRDSKQVSANTTSSLTISGTWNFTDSNGWYILYKPVYLGAAAYPWRRVFAGEDIRLGFGPSNGNTVTFIKTGTGSPENVVTAGPGSIYLRNDGGAGTSLYVKQSGTGNTGWVGK